jgi:hypothetical protein
MLYGMVAAIYFGDSLRLKSLGHKILSTGTDYKAAFTESRFSGFLVTLMMGGAGDDSPAPSSSAHGRGGCHILFWRALGSALGLGER